MGRHKEWELKKEERWDNKARANNYVCRWHGGPIEYSDRLVYFYDWELFVLPSHNDEG